MTERTHFEGITDTRVLEAMRRVPRQELVPPEERAFAQEDRPLPIGYGQTISQPYVVALMTELLGVEPTDRILEVGTGSGYQAAILSLLAREVYTIELVQALGVRAQEDLKRLGLSENVHFKLGDGYAGWPQAAPFDGIIVTAAPRQVPPPLIEQLAEGARLVIPVGDDRQFLKVFERRGGRIVTEESIPVRFVPMTGRAEND